jgi:hypothetical protein
MRKHFPRLVGEQFFVSSNSPATEQQQQRQKQKITNKFVQIIVRT